MHHAIAAVLCSLAFSTAMASTSPASLTFEKQTVDVTVEAEADSTTITFPFENKSEETIEIAKHASPCGCISTSFKDDRMIYPPGARGELTIVFKVGNFYGTVQKKIMVWMKDSPKGKRSPITLTTKITIPELITVTPRTLNWKTGESNAPKSYKIAVSHDKPIHITSLACTNNNFDTELKTLRDGMEYELTVTPRDYSEASFGIIKIFTDSKVSRYRLVQVFANIRKDVSGK
jgi:hypothetical protein